MRASEQGTQRVYSFFLFNLKKKGKRRVYVELTVPPLPSVKTPYFTSSISVSHFSSKWHFFSKKTSSLLVRIV